MHPKWQRHVVADLKRTFPNIQFVCASHSPQIIGELEREAVIDLRGEQSGPPSVAYGADSSWILNHVMDADSRTFPARKAIREAEDALDEADFPRARAALDRLRSMLNGEDGDLVRLESSLYTLETLAGADDHEAE